MISLHELNNSEMEYLCQAIPPAVTASYFTQFPKNFQKIRRGFRVKSLKPHELTKVLFDNRNVPFIERFVQKQAEFLIEDIEKYHSGLVDKGTLPIDAYIYTLADSRFDKNVSLFFKILGNTDFGDEVIGVIESAVRVYQQSKSVQKTQIEHDKALEEEVNKLRNQFKTVEIENIELQKRISFLQTENSALEKEMQKNADIENSYKKASEEVSALSRKVHKLEENLYQVRNSLQQEKKTSQELKTELCTVQASIAESIRNKSEPRYAIGPVDIEEFKECLEYNFDSIGLDNTYRFRTILVNYLSAILFRGEPIITNQVVAHSLASCVSNALHGVRVPDILVYSPETSNGDIQHFLEVSTRVVCLDGFLGNYNELELIPLIALFREKIIFLTCTSERTIKYLADDVLLNCIYFNANRVVPFLHASITDDDPSSIDEKIYEDFRLRQDNRYRNIFREIAEQCHISVPLYSKWEADVSSDDSLSQVIGFTLLPYCYDVCYSKPYKMSSRLQKYAGDSGRCQYRDIFLRWFAR